MSMTSWNHKCVEKIDLAVSIIIFIAILMFGACLPELDGCVDLLLHAPTSSETADPPPAASGSFPLKQFSVSLQLKDNSGLFIYFLFPNL